MGSGSTDLIDIYQIKNRHRLPVSLFAGRLHLTTSLGDVAVFIRHPDLLEGVLSELPWIRVQNELIVV